MGKRGIVRFAGLKFPLKKSLRTIYVHVVVVPSEEIPEKEGPQYMNKWLRRVLWVFKAPSLLALLILCIVGWVLICISPSEPNEKPPLVVAGQSSCTVAMQKWKKRAEKA